MRQPTSRAKRPPSQPTTKLRGITITVKASDIASQMTVNSRAMSGASESGVNARE
jgi:hypothetical protein